jgi:hypothetical protein
MVRAIEISTAAATRVDAKTVAIVPANGPRRRKGAAAALSVAVVLMLAAVVGVRRLIWPRLGTTATVTVLVPRLTPELWIRRMVGSRRTAPYRL